MDEMLDILGKEIKIREMSKPLSKPKSGYMDEKEHKKSKNLNTTSALFMKKDNGLCAFCQESTLTKIAERCPIWTRGREL